MENLLNDLNREQRLAVTGSRLGNSRGGRENLCTCISAYLISDLVCSMLIFVSRPQTNFSAQMRERLVEDRGEEAENVIELPSACRILRRILINGL